MNGYSALAASPAVEGAFVSGDYNVAASVVSATGAGLRAGAGGVSVARFGWAGPDGIVKNSRNSSQDKLGIVLPWCGLNDWRAVFFDSVSRTHKIREGLPLTMISCGSIYLRFAFGAQVAQPVYANVLDGSAISGYSADAELTPWTVASNCRAHQLSIVTTWSNYP